MGHHSLAKMLNVQAALAEVDPDIYIYGEGWNFGEVADNARFVQATHLNPGGQVSVPSVTACATPCAAAVALTAAMI